ncbi:MAG: hypothetical protein AABW63_01065 [Nanoarchaeota archaeon]
MKTNSTKRFFEIFGSLILIFLLISIVFLIFNYGFKLFFDTNSTFIWIVIALLTTLVVFYIIKFLIRKNFLRMKSGRVSEVEVDY